MAEDEKKKDSDEQIMPQRPKHIFRTNQKNDPLRSKSAPAEDFSNETEDTEDYIGSYNYFLYYNSIKPVDPRLPKPTFKPKPNLDFIKETKDKEEEDEEPKEQGNEKLNINHMNQLEDLAHLTNELNQLNLEQNTNSSNNNQDSSNQNIFNDNFPNKIPKNQNQNNKNNFNPINEAASPFEYYSQSMNAPRQNDLSQQQMWGEQNLGLNGMGLQMYPTNMANMGGMVGMGMNPMNPLIGMNMGINSYGNFSQYGNMMGLNPTLMNPNANRMNSGNGQYNYGKKNQKKGNNRAQEDFDPVTLQNQAFNNLYNNMPNNGFGFPQQNPMMNMGMNMNYLNDQQRFQIMQMQQNMLRNNIIQGNMNNLDFYQNNSNNQNKMSSKKNKKGENFVRKEVNEYKNIEDVIEKAVLLSKDHSGSRLVQRKYEEGNEEIRNKIFEKFKPENELSLHMYGCRVMQQLISVIDEKYLPQITLELKDHFEKCIEDQNGNHVIQKLIERLKPGENKGIYDVVYKNLVELSRHQYGCRVIQTLLKKCNQEQISKMLEKIYKNVKELSEDQYGNYIIQYILENQKNIDPIYEGLKGNIYDFSIHKYASNVVERALNFGNAQQRQNIINEIIMQDDQMKECLLSMVKDKFGNYVVQKLIEFSDEEMRENIIKRIISSQSLKKKDGFSKHVINFIEKFKTENAGINLSLNPNEANKRK